MLDILICSNSNLYRDRVNSILKEKGRRLQQTESLESTKAAIEKKNIRLVVLFDDFNLTENPSHIGELALMLKPTGKLVVLGESRSKENIRLILDKGAQDYISLPFDDFLLKIKIRKLLGAGTKNDLAMTRCYSPAILSIGALEVPVHLKSITELGMSFYSSHPFQKGKVIQVGVNTDTTIFEKISGFLGKVDRVLKTDDHFIIRISFIGMEESFRRDIRKITLNYKFL